MLGGISLIIGLYDSGLGGLTVWRELRKLKVKLVYFGDTANVPYGAKTSQELVGYFHEIRALLVERGCQLVVVACNTASILVLPAVEKDPNLPTIGIVDAAVNACLQVCQGRLGILATPATIASGVYQKTFREVRPDWAIYAQSAPELAPLIEAGKVDHPDTQKLIIDYLAPLQDRKIDTLLLGCTHYPLVQSSIAEFLGPSVTIVDPAPFLAQQITGLIGQLQTEMQPETEFWVSARPELFKELAQNLLGEELPEVGFYQLAGEKLK